MDFFNVNADLFIGILLEEDRDRYDGPISQVYDFIINYFRNYLRLERKVLRDEMDPYEIPDFQFKQLFRLDKHTSTNLIRDLLPHIPQRNNSAITLTKKVGWDLINKYLLYSY